MSRDTNTYLSEAEIESLTSKVYAKVQAKKLAERGWVFELDGDDKPLILRAYHDQRLGMVPKPARARRPRLAHLSRRAA